MTAATGLTCRLKCQEVLKNAYQTYIESNGYFDPTVGKLIDLWGFGNSRKTKKIPDDEQISEALKTVGFNKLLFNPDFTQIKKAIPEVKINLSAIAKGYGVDRIAKLLDNFGYTDYIVDIGGEVKTRGSRTANGKGWNVAVALPNSLNNENAYVVGLKDYAWPHLEITVISFTIKKNDTPIQFHPKTDTR